MADTKYVPRELGRTGIRHTNSSLVDDELAKNLRWPHSINTYNKMESDSLIGGSLFLIKQYIRKADSEIQPYNGLKATPDQLAKAEHVRNALYKHMDRSFDAVVSDILSFIKYGFSFHEPLYKLDASGKFIWKDFPIRSQGSITDFKFKNSKFTGIEQQVLNTDSFITASTIKKFIPKERLLHFRTDGYRDDPLGRSVLKNAYKSYYFKTMLEETEATSAEKELNGLPSITFPAEYWAADPIEDPEKYAVLQSLLAIGANARNNEQAFIGLPSERDESGNLLFTFELLASKGTRGIDISKIVERYDNRIAQSMMTDFMLMGAGSGGGSFALSDNKIGSFVASLEAFLEVIAEQFNRKAIPELYRMNGWDVNESCTLKFKPIGSATLTELGNFLEKGKNFITPDSTLENALRAKADLPDRDEANQYIDVPTATHQALSQRIAMEASAGNVDAVEDSVVDDVDSEAIMKALMGEHYGH